MRRTLTKYTTSVGIARYPHLSEPDTKFDEDGVYTTQLILDVDDVEELEGLIETAKNELADEIRSQKPNTKFKDGASPITDHDEDATKRIVKFKLKAKGGKGSETWDQKPAIFDAKAKPFTGSENIGGGSKIKVSCEIVPYHTALAGLGVSLRLKAVQVIDLVEFTGKTGDASAHGFSEEEGFDSSSVETQTSHATDEDIPF